MGHARTYIAFDILRRIFRDYFMFDVVYVLNITDIDDKVIKRARQNYLMEKYCERDNDLVTLYNDISKAIRYLKIKSTSDPDPDKREFFERESERLILLLSSKPPNGEDAVAYLVRNARDALADVLDKEHGASITDHKIFEAVARRFEKEYHSDMKALNVLEPDVLVRVTEYIEPIISFIQKIIDNGFGYVASSGSVYFDTNLFASDPRHFYAKLVPTAYGDADQLATGEGELASGGEKRCPNDFALWKASKKGEPAWSSPWGPGRPGWHIECSVMASGILGDSMEIHGGGVDLKFPHHDNELAQSEAYFGHSHWVHYFLHAGHLTISGCKMSKSLKNFITIRDALKQCSARRLRLTFLLHSWQDTMDYGPDTLAEAVAYEKMLVDFLYNVTSLHLMANECHSTSAHDSVTSEIGTLMSQLAKTQRDVYEALCDSCDTRRAMAVLKELISFADQYALVQAEPSMPLMDRTNQVFMVACFVLRLLRVLGVADLTTASRGTPVPADGVVAGGQLPAESDPILGEAFCKLDRSTLLSRSWLSLDSPTVERLASALYAGLRAANNLSDVLLSSVCLELAVKSATKESLSDLMRKPFALETEVWPVVFQLLYRLVSVRQSVRSELLSGTHTDKEVKQRVLMACDRMRDVDLVVAGVRLQDRCTSAELSLGLQLAPFLGLVDPLILSEEVEAKSKVTNRFKIIPVCLFLCTYRVVSLRVAMTHQPVEHSRNCD
ncbi:cysteinyl-tRNA synthetase [Paragonimus westermani]|uniref:cysteine--tRNA ligase n=1 Tax=Paragonimus westermani TaxID=34504 RepID=A0A5J4NZ38_9TREM|nr:cysteinyl-tRNA synthetase [Paragonimus westermani]